MRGLPPSFLFLVVVLIGLAATTGGESDATKLEPRAVANSVNKGKSQGKTAKPAEKKYFHEPGWDAESGHYDIRYFRGKVPYEEHRPVLRHLIRSYLTTFKALGAETWLAHGSLLGWWWNGRIMPWDYDLDVQVSVATLSFLAERYNRSIHEYDYANDDGDASSRWRRAELGSQRGIQDEMDSMDSMDDGGSNNTQGEIEEVVPRVKKAYLLDINPYYTAMTKGNGANVIDARWIDMSNGMFIDITGLRERDIEHSPGVWSCKNNHRYRTDELWPLRRTEFEGVEAWIPYEFDKVLTDEYGPKSLVTTEWAGHRWTPELKEWIKMPKKPKKKPTKKKEHHIVDEKGNEKVVVYEEVVVEV